MNSNQNAVSSNVVWHHATVTRARREAMNGHRGAILWFTGLSGAGKSTLALPWKMLYTSVAAAPLYWMETMCATDCVGTLVSRRKRVSKTSVAWAKSPSSLWKPE